MAGRGMGVATKGGGCVSSGSRNKMTSKPSSKVAVMMKDGGDVKSKDKKKDYKVSPIGSGIAMAMEAIGAKKKKASKTIASDSEVMGKPKKKMGGGMMKKYKKGGYASK
jgi:hypothetical protein